MSPIPFAQPAQEFVTVKTWTLDSFFDLVHLRSALAWTIAPQDADLPPSATRVVRGMVLVTNELASNSLEHAHPPTTVTLKADDAHYLLEITDHDPDAAPVVTRGRMPGEQGFGLELARKIATDMGWYAEAHTKHVWATFPIREERSPAPSRC
jgi:serine/threonine-protein kinase RsbW